VLTDAEIAAFETDGFVAVRGAVPPHVVAAGQAELWDEVTAACGAVPDDPATWTQPVVRLGGLATAPFRDAAVAAPLREAYDQLVGPGRWVPPGGLGTWPVRFPHPDPPGDDGWHLEASFAGAAGEMRVSLRSRGRALLLLFLYSDVGPDDAPTRVRVGSHRDVPPLLADAGEEGREWLELCGDAVPASAGRPEALVTGRAGDVVLCHPFLVHAAQPHRGSVPRFMAQPPLVPAGELDPAGPSPVERALGAGLRPGSDAGSRAPR
jgi:hypothetical protein